MTDSPRTIASPDSQAPVLVERRGHVLLIGVNRADKRNAWDLATIHAVGAAYQQLGTDPQLRVGVVHGLGEHFSVGLDLAEVGPAVASQGPAALSGGFDFDPFGVWAPRRCPSRSCWPCRASPTR